MAPSIAAGLCRDRYPLFMFCVKWPPADTGLTNCLRTMRKLIPYALLMGQCSTSFKKQKTFVKKNTRVPRLYVHIHTYTGSECCIANDTQPPAYQPTCGADGIMRVFPTNVMGRYTRHLPSPPPPPASLSKARISAAGSSRSARQQPTRTCGFEPPSRCCCWGSRGKSAAGSTAVKSAGMMRTEVSGRPGRGATRGRGQGREDRAARTPCHDVVLS